MLLPHYVAYCVIIRFFKNKLDIFLWLVKLMVAVAGFPMPLQSPYGPQKHLFPFYQNIFLGLWRKFANSSVCASAFVGKISPDLGIEIRKTSVLSIPNFVVKSGRLFIQVNIRAIHECIKFCSSYKRSANSFQTCKIFIATFGNSDIFSHFLGDPVL